VTGPEGASGPGAVLVTLTLWGVRRTAVPAALARMALDRRPVRRTPGVRFAKLLGTGDGRTFTVRDADPLHWGLLAVWDGEEQAREFETGATHRRWQELSTERLHVRMRPIASRGLWAGVEPFGRPVAARAAGPVAAVTRARIRARKAPAFWRAVPPVSADLHATRGLRLAVGIGEAPVGLQGTFSIWDGGPSLTEFTQLRGPHARVAARTPREGWYAEELFARFAVLSAEGSFAGANPLTPRAP
jgi:hypothetical protein